MFSRRFVTFWITWKRRQKYPIVWSERKRHDAWRCFSFLGTQKASNNFQHHKNISTAYCQLLPSFKKFFRNSKITMNKLKSLIVYSSLTRKTDAGFLSVAIMLIVSVAAFGKMRGRAFPRKPWQSKWRHSTRLYKRLISMLLKATRSSRKVSQSRNLDR